MRKAIFALLFLFLAQIVNAQQPAQIETPEGIGAYMYELVTKRADIRKSPIYIKGLDVYIKKYRQATASTKKNGTPQRLENGKKQAWAVNDGSSYFYQVNQLEDNWIYLLRNADEAGLTPETTQYVKTYFRLNFFPQSVSPLIEINVEMENQGKNVVLNFVVQKMENRWYLLQVSPYLYQRTLSDDGDQFVFRPLSQTASFDEEEELVDEAVSADSVDGAIDAAVDFEAPMVVGLDSVDLISKVVYDKYTNNVQPSMVQGSIIAPVAFTLDDVLNKLLHQSPFAGDGLFLTEQEYKAISGNAIKELIKKVLESDQYTDHDKKEAAVYLSDPSSVYDMNLRSAWTLLQQDLKNEFGDDIQDLFPYSMEVEISDWDRKRLIEDNLIVANVSIDFSKKEHQAGITFDLLWYEGQWRILYVQSSTYGIGSAEAEEAISE